MTGRERMPGLSPRLPGFAALALFGGITLASGPLIGIGALIALVAGFGLAMSPLAGVILALFANTSFQVIGAPNISGLPIGLSKLSAAIVVGSWVLHLLTRRWPVTASAMFRPLLAWFVIVLAWDLVRTQGDAEPMEGVSRFVQIAALTVVIANIAGQKERWLDATILGFSAAMACCGLIGLAEHFLPSLAVESDDPRLAQASLGGIMDRESLDGVVIKRISGGVGDANWLAYSIAIALPLLVWGWHRWDSLAARCGLALLGGLQLIALVLSYTRTGFLGLGVAFLYMLLRGVVPLRPVLYGSVLMLAAGLVYMPPGFLDRMFSSSYLKEGSTPLRAFLVGGAAEIWADSPLVGHGYKGFGQRFYDKVTTRLPDDIRMTAWAEDLQTSVLEKRESVGNIGAHNLYLEILVEYGLVGGLAYAAMLFIAFRDLYWIERHGPPRFRILAICLTAAILAFLTCGLLGHSKYLKAFWIVLGLVMALRRLSAIGDTDARTIGQSRAGPA